MSETIIAKVVDRAQAAIDPAEGIAAVSDTGFGGIDVFIGKFKNRCKSGSWVRTLVRIGLKS